MALHRAVLQGRPQQVKYLLGTRNCKYNGINAKDGGSKTPLILTCQVEQIKIAICIARLLLTKGAQVGISDGDGRNALSHACIRRRHELVKLFLTQVDYDLNMVDGDGNSPLHHAAISGDVDVVRDMVTVFKKNHSSVDLSNKSGETPLMIASKLGFISCAEVLITVGLASLTKRDNINFMNALEWAQTNTANDNVNLSNIYCKPKQNNSPRSNSAPNKLVGNEEEMSNNEEDEEEDKNTKSMTKCLATAYRIYEVQNSTSYRISSMSPIKPTPAILTSFFDFHKDGTYSIEDVMWLVSKGKTVSNNGSPKSLIRRHTDSRLSPRNSLKSPNPGNSSVLESLSLDLDSRLNGIQPGTVTTYLDTSDSDLDSDDDVFYSLDSHEIYSSDTKGRQRKRPKHRRRTSNFERLDSGIQESATAESSDDQTSENNRPNTRSDSFLTPPVTVAKQRLGTFTDIRILKVMKSPNRSPDPTWRMAKTTDELLLRPENSPTRQYRANSESALDTKAFISRTGSDSALNKKALSSPSIARWQNAVCEIRDKIQNNVRFNLESRSSTRNSRPRTGMSTRANSVQLRKDQVCRRNSESNKYAAQNLEDDQEYGNSQSTNGRKTRSRNKKITLDSPGSNSTTMGQKPKRETRREWKRQQEMESEKRRNDLNRKIDSLRSELGKMDARWRARKYHPQLPENILSNINNDLENASRRTPGAQSEVASRRTPGAQSEEEMEVSDASTKTQLTNSNIDVRFNDFDSRLSWSAKCPTDSSLTSSISLPSLGWSSSSEDLLRSEEFEKEGISCSAEIDKLQKQGRKQRLRQISSIRRPAQAPNQIVTDSSRKQSEYSRFDTNTLRIKVPSNPVTRAKTTSTRGSSKRHVSRQFQQHP